jgi:hypothetical protein
MMRYAMGVLALATVAACVEEVGPPPVTSSGASISACPRRPPKGCATKRTLAADATPVLARHCYRCHASGAPSFAAEDHDFTDERTLRSQRARVLAKVAACVMPPDRPESLTVEEAAALMEWAACGD